MLTHDLLRELRDFLQSLEEQARKLLGRRNDAPTTAGPLREAFFEGQALRLSDYYASCERILERIAVAINGEPPAGRDSHRILLDRMKLDIPGVRPPVLSPGAYTLLNGLRKFRHAMRRLYGVAIDEEMLQAELGRLPELNRLFVADLGTFLETMDRALGGASRPEGSA